MDGKHRNWIVHTLATIERERLRSKIANLVEWQPLTNPEIGCTAIVGVCSKLPDILIANMRCLWSRRWSELRRVLLVVDAEQGSFPAQIEAQVKAAYPKLNAEFLYYSARQSASAEALKLPFVYSWLSWCIALKHTTTSHVLFHDYDALILSMTLAERYKRFTASQAKVQGIGWYKGNGIEADDGLATTFEAFMDAVWLRSSRPTALFNKLRIIGGRSIDYDTTLDLQHRFLTPEQRAIIPMGPDDLVHPSQMIHQYTMFRRSPAAALPCFAVPMIPFFSYLSGNTGAVDSASRALQFGRREDMDLLSDGTQINLSMLNAAQVDWALKQIVQSCLALSLAPDQKIYRYGEALYRIIRTSANDIWRGDFTDDQRMWISASATRLKS